MQSLRPALLVCLSVALWVTANLAGGQETSPREEPESIQQKYDSLRVTVFKRTLRDSKQQNWGVDFRLRAALGVHKFETFDDLLEFDVEHLQSVGLRPGLEFEFPTRLPGVSFVPKVELSWHHLLDSGRDLLSGSAAAAWRYTRPGENQDLILELSGKYGTRYDEDGINFEDYFELSVSADLRRALKLKMGQRRLVVVPFAKASRFIDNLEFESRNGTLYNVSSRFEVGLKFNTRPAWFLGRIKMPDIRISYLFGDDLTGLKIRL